MFSSNWAVAPVMIGFMSFNLSYYWGSYFVSKFHRLAFDSIRAIMAGATLDALYLRIWDELKDLLCFGPNILNSLMAGDMITDSA